MVQFGKAGFQKQTKNKIWKDFQKKNTPLRSTERYVANFLQTFVFLSNLAECSKHMADANMLDNHTRRYKIPFRTKRNTCILLKDQSTAELLKEAAPATAKVILTLCV